MLSYQEAGTKAWAGGIWGCQAPAPPVGTNDDHAPDEQQGLGWEGVSLAQEAEFQGWPWAIPTKEQAGHAQVGRARS